MFASARNGTAHETNFRWARNISSGIARFRRRRARKTPAISANFYRESCWTHPTTVPVMNAQANVRQRTDRIGQWA